MRKCLVYKIHLQTFQREWSHMASHQEPGGETWEREWSQSGMLLAGSGRSGTAGQFTNAYVHYCVFSKVGFYII